MRLNHVFNRVRYQVSARQAVQHSVVPHGDSIVNSNSVELFGHPACLFDLASNHLPQVFKVHMTGDELGKGVGNGDDRFVKVFVGHTGGAP